MKTAQKMNDARNFIIGRRKISHKKIFTYFVKISHKKILPKIAHEKIKTLQKVPGFVSK